MVLFALTTLMIGRCTDSVIQAGQKCRNWRLWAQTFHHEGSKWSVAVRSYFGPAWLTRPGGGREGGRRRRKERRRSQENDDRCDDGGEWQKQRDERRERGEKTSGENEQAGGGRTSWPARSWWGWRRQVAEEAARRAGWVSWSLPAGFWSNLAKISG